MVASDHTFVKKNRVVFFVLVICSTFTKDHTFGYHVLPQAGRSYNNASR